MGAPVPDVINAAVHNRGGCSVSVFQKPTPTSNAGFGDAFLAAGPMASHRAASRVTRLGPSFDDDAPWTDFDLKRYLQANWHPGAPLGGTCDRLVRIGERGDGGKLACNPAALLRTFAPSTPCIAISVGSNADFSFEAAVHAINPTCELHTIDPLLTSAEIIPPAINASAHRLVADTFSASSAVAPALYAGRTINLLKLVAVPAIELWGPREFLSYMHPTATWHRAT